MRQLAVIREGYPALSEAVAAVFLAAWSEDSCRAHGAQTRGVDVFRAAMNWARTLESKRGDAAIDPVHARWFLDCATLLGRTLSGDAPSRDPRWVSSMDDAQKSAATRVARVSRRLGELAGDDAARRASLDHALAPVDGKDLAVSRLEGLASLCEAWRGELGAALDAKGLGADACADLRARAKAITDLAAKRPAPTQLQAARDTPATNAAEGRLLRAMRPLWDDFAEAREDGRSALLLTVTPALLRGMGLNPRRSAPSAGPTG